MSYKCLSNVKLLCALFALQYQFLCLGRLKSPHWVDQSPYSMPKFTAKEASSQSCCIRAAAQPKIDHIAPGGNCPAARSTPQQRALRFNASLVQKIPRSLVSKECHGHQAAAEFEQELFLLIMPCYCTRKGKKRRKNIYQTKKEAKSRLYDQRNTEYSVPTESTALSQTLMLEN